MIVQEQSPARVMEVRAKLYELLSHCIPPSVVLKVRAFPRPVLGATRRLKLPSRPSSLYF